MSQTIYLLSCFTYNNSCAGSYDVCTSEIEVTVENKEELNTEKAKGSQDKAADFVENVALESKGNMFVTTVQ